ncbi:PRC and DUF2382 domain-containing protein [Aquipuribacter sp. SD81]|uniref:PRC and DUF2382 domain-containing protein n=1 Tax=Aquipuribacter sp. SD81 TaxID=3127703 RepID=UPI0030170029
MITTDQVQALLDGDGTVVGRDGEKLGSVGQVFLDDRTGTPEWVTVTTGLFGTSQSFVPLAEGTADGSRVTVPYAKDTVKGAPRVDDSAGHLSQEQEGELYRHYGLADPSHDEADRTDRTDRAQTGGAPAGAQGRDTSGPTTDEAMTRSEEQLHVGTERVERGRARLRKYVVTEDVTTTVPVSHEEVRLEREPVTDANRDEAMSGGDLTSEEHEVVLTEERVTVDKETVPVERVRVGTETVTEDREVTEQVRKEQIEQVDGGEGSDAPRPDARR